MDDDVEKEEEGEEGEDALAPVPELKPNLNPKLYTEPEPEDLDLWTTFLSIC